MATRRVMVCGVTGYLGSHLAITCLKQGHKVLGVARNLGDHQLLHNLLSTHPQNTNIELQQLDLKVFATSQSEVISSCDYILDTCGIHKSYVLPKRTLSFYCASMVDIAQLRSLSSGTHIVLPNLLGSILTKRSQYGPLMDLIIGFMRGQPIASAAPSFAEFADVQEVTQLAVDQLADWREGRLRIRGQYIEILEILQTVQRIANNTFGYQLMEPILPTGNANDLHKRCIEFKYEYEAIAHPTVLGRIP